jgi:colanic acid biosynthesis glycosyl transferase WcaI
MTETNPSSLRRLRIAIIGINYLPEPTGNAPYTSNLAEGLAAAGHSVRVITGYPHYPEWKRQDGYTGWSLREKSRSVEVHRLRHHIPKIPTTLSRMHMELSFGVRAIFARWGNPDVVLVVSPALFSCGLVLLRSRLQHRRPATAVWVQDIYSRGMVETGTGGGAAAKVVSVLESRILRLADRVVAIHERFKHYLAESLSVPSGDISVIRNWTHLPAAKPSDRAHVRNSLGWGEAEIIVLHAGNMGKKQGLENVVEAAKLAAAKGSAVRFVLLGDGNQRRLLEDAAKGVGNLQFISPLPGESFQQALAAADVLLVNELPGIKEMAVPSKLTSYFNAGVPVIAATDEGSVTATEISVSGGGIRVDAADPAALVSAAERVGNDPGTARAMGESGLRFRHETLSESAALAHYDEFITSLASTRGN